MSCPSAEPGPGGDTGGGRRRQSRSSCPWPVCPAPSALTRQRPPPPRREGGAEPAPAARHPPTPAFAIGTRSTTPPPHRRLNSSVMASGTYLTSPSSGDILSRYWQSCTPTPIGTGGGRVRDGWGSATPRRTRGGGGAGAGGGGCRNPLTLTAISLSVSQRRSVPLWSLRDLMPSDALTVTAHPTDGVVVTGVNEVLYIDGSGRMRGGLAANGFARCTCAAGTVVSTVIDDAGADADPSSRSLVVGGGEGGGGPGPVSPNPSPLPRLSLHLDGSSLSFLSRDVAALSLSDGTLYYLDIPPTTPVGGGGGGTLPLSLAPMGYRVGACGAVTCLSALPILSASVDVATEEKTSNSDDPLPGDDGVKPYSASGRLQVSAGLLFAGSRLGDSGLIAYRMTEGTPLGDRGERRSSSGRKEKKSTPALPAKSLPTREGGGAAGHPPPATETEERRERRRRCQGPIRGPHRRCQRAHERGGGGGR